MSRYEKALWIFPAVADAAPFLYGLLILGLWPNVPKPIVVICSLAPITVGIIVLIALPFLKRRAMIPRRSDAALIAITLAIVGVVEPLFYYY